MWFKKKKTEQIIIDINDIKNYVLENCEPNVKEIMFSEREKVSFSISDSEPSGQYMLDLNKLDDIENVPVEQAAEKLDEVIKESFSDVLVNYIVEKDVKNGLHLHTCFRVENRFIKC